MCIAIGIGIRIPFQQLEGVKKYCVLVAVAMGGVHSTPESVAAFVATGLISLAPNVLLLFLPRYATDSRGSSTWLALGQAIGAGGLMADVFLHTLVESSRSNAEMNESMGFYIMLGFVVFFAVDLLVRAVNEQHSISCSHSSSTASQITSMKAGIDGEVDGTVAIKRSLILLNLVADALHNFTDGMAIGASYAINSKATATAPLKAVTVASVWSLFKSHPRGGFATLSILFHEIPHELSKFESVPFDPIVSGLFI